MFSIGDLSRRTGVKVPTIRYYEQMGLLDLPDRSEGNQRRYGREGLERLSFIRHARDLGFNIEAIRELIELSCDPEKPCRDADRIVAEQLNAVRQKIARLSKLERELDRMANHCEADCIRDCYVLHSLGDHGLCNADH
ncbi:MerR family transcriptional regulator [Georhizobium profundi]|jgi:DNA-binding transcriptional MerR regulator|uniref:MerR family transcriptional regulator n=1 Tax=Georhizobium profundi TaxID=2341112 RepID=A0A3Q8XNA3_9HYPH|nr:helix-turn-helix domain-containing protein [Georhizobium profundi]AZN71512.1 MerR family transcriptional regulator [Georhizobium profundi]